MALPKGHGADARQWPRIPRARRSGFRWQVSLAVKHCNTRCHGTG